MDIREIGEKTRDWIIEKRRDLHRIPELSYQETQTQAYIMKVLRELGLKPEPFADTGVFAYIEGGAGALDEQRTIALISDMDGLAVTEETGLPFASEHHGMMHACGHDGHMSIMLGAAKILLERKDKINGRVKIMFYPGEESAVGSEKAIARGALEGVDGVFGCHLWSDIPSGKITVQSGPIMAASDAFFIEVKGKGCHGAMPHLGIDPIYAASRIVVALKAAPGTMIDPLQSAVVTVCEFSAGTEWNRIPETASLAGTTRCFDNDLRKNIQDMVEEVAKKTAEETGASAEVRWEHGSAVVINDKSSSRTAEKALEKVCGPDVSFHYDGTMSGDDFAEYLNRKPGVFAMIGVSDPSKHTDAPQHSPRFDIDEDMLVKGSELAAQYAVDWLSGSRG